MSTDAEISTNLRLGEEMLDRGHPELAIDYFRRVLTVDPDEALAHALLALALVRTKRVGAALIEARMACTLAPDLAQAHTVLGTVHFVHNKPILAREEFEIAKKLNPTDPSPLRGLAHLHRHEGQYEKALALLREALAFDPEDEATLTAMGQTFLNRGQIDEALRYAQMALEIEPENTDALVLMGTILLRRNDVDGAREHAIWALRNTPNDPDVINLLIQIKAHQSWLLGLWFRFNSWFSTMGARAYVILIVAYVLQRFASLLLQDFGYPALADIVLWTWVGLCVYTWIGPGIFRGMIESEIETIKLKEEF